MGGERYENVPRPALVAALEAYERRAGLRPSPGGALRVEVRYLPAIGKIAPPRTLVAFCEPDALEGVRRSIEKLNESRGWRASVEVAGGDGDGVS